MDTSELLTVGAGGISVGGILTFFLLQSRLRAYVRQEAGKKEEIGVSVQSPLEIKGVAIYAEKNETEKRFSEVKSDIANVEIHFDAKIERLRTEGKADLEKMSRDAVDGRRLIHAEIRSAADKTNQHIINLTSSVSELKGEIKGLK